ncbi:MAG: triple tyrosine motif-containing protein [Ferruginibacter sp.]
MIAVIVFIFPFSIAAQNTIGIPNIVNYPKQIYNAGSQNWNIAQDKNGIMYFANNNGMLAFDGSSWRIYQLPNKTIVRSIAIDEDGRIYAGGQAEFGYFFPGSNGELQFTSLKNLLPANDNDFADVWNISFFKGHVFFRSNKKIMEYDRKKVILYPSVNWGFMGSLSAHLFAYEGEKGLLTYDQGQWKPALKSGTLPAAVLVRAIVDIGNDSVLLATMVNGLYLISHDTLSKFETPDISDAAAKNISGVCLLAPGKIAVTSNLGGCIIMDSKGKFIQRFTKKEGIQSNNILSVMLDKDKNLWFGLDNGIDLVTYSNSIKNIFPDQEDRNSGYTSIIHNRQLYMGVSTGVYKIDLNPGISDLSFTNGSFEFVENSKGQVWSLSEVDGQLLMGHNKGAFSISNGVATAIDTKTGFWGFQPLKDSAFSPVILAGTYNGINFYNYKQGNTITLRMNSLFESARFVAIGKNVIWIAHPYKGIYKIVFNEAGLPVASTYVDKKKILSSNHNKIFKVRDKILLTTDKGIFEYDESINDFTRSVYFENLFGGFPVDYIKEDKAGNIWFCRDRKVGIVNTMSKDHRVIFIPEIDGRIMGGGFEHIDIVDSNNVFIAAEKGFFHINYAEYKKNKQSLRVLIRNVRSALQKDGLIYGGYSVQTSIPSIEHAYNALHFECSSALFGQEQNTEYSYYLEGFDKGWSDWGKKTEKDYTNLPAGKYIFKVKCRNNFDNESPVSTFTFRILPPWYQTWWAYTLYVLLFAGLIYLFYKRQQRKYKRLQQLKLEEQQRKYDEEQKQLQLQHELEIGKSEKQIIQLRNEKLLADMEQKKLQDEQERLQFQHQIEVEKNEKVIINLRNEKLQAEVEHKNSELASSAMNLVRKMEILSKLKEDLQQFRHHEGMEKTSKDFHKIIKVLDKELDHNQEWEQFAIHFDSVHTNYLKKLKDHCPDLTASELKMAAYIRLNLTTKEIAQLMNISLRGAETGRYRLRKKLGLANEVNLFDFLIAVTK